MQVFSKIRHFSVYRKIILTYILLITITVLLLSSVLFSLFSKSTVKEIGANSISMLNQTSHASDIIYSQVTNLSNQISLDNRIITFLYSDTDDKIAIYNASLMLQNIIHVYPFINNIEICNLANGHYYSTLDAPAGIIESYKEDTFNLLAEKKKSYMSFLPRKQPLSANHDIRTLSFILFPDFLTSANNAIVINIDENYLQQTIQSLDSHPTDFSTFVMDADGNILSHSDPIFFMDSFAGQDYVRKILNSGNGEGSFTKSVDGDKQLVTFVRSEAMDWYFVSMKPYGNLLHNLNDLRNVTVLTGLLLIVAGILISLWLTGNLYTPIKSLMELIKPLSKETGAPVRAFNEFEMLSDAFSKSREETNSMKYSMEQSSRIVKEKYLLSLLKGNINAASTPKDILSNIQSQLTGPYFRIYVFKIDNYQTFKEKVDEKERSIFRFAVCNIAQELLGKHNKNDSFITEEDEIVILEQSESVDIDGNTLTALAEIQDGVKKYYYSTVSIGIGDTVGAFNQVSASYTSAMEYVKYRLFYGSECIMDQSRVKEHNTDIVKYPRAIEKKLIESLQSENHDQLLRSLEEFFKSLSKASYYEAINYSNQLVLAVFKNLEDNLALIHEVYKGFIDNMNQLSPQESLSSIQSNILEFCSRTMLLLEEKNNTNSMQKHIKIIDEVKAYLQENYSDPLLSIDLVSDKVGLSSGYLGKIFKNVENVSFSDYLLSFRLNKASALLTSTNEPVFKICQMVGIYNITYFSTLFKKAFGSTPSQYRS